MRVLTVRADISGFVTAFPISMDWFDVSHLKGGVDDGNKHMRGLRLQ